MTLKPRQTRKERYAALERRVKTLDAAIERNAQTVDANACECSNPDCTTCKARKNAAASIRFAKEEQQEILRDYPELHTNKVAWLTEASE